MTFDGGIGIGFFDERTGTTYHDLFQQIEEGDASFLLQVGTPGNLEVSIEITDTRGRKVTAISASKEVDLIVQVEDVVVDGSGSDENEFLALAADLPTPIVRSKNALQVLVALGVAVAEIMAFIHQENIGILRIADVKFISPERFLCDDMRRNARAQQFVVPHLL